MEKGDDANRAARRALPILLALIIVGSGQAFAEERDAGCRAWSEATTNAAKRAALIECARAQFGPPPEACSRTIAGCRAFASSRMILPETRWQFTPPRPAYPEEAGALEGRCDVQFDVTAAGFTRNLRVECTDPVFAPSATQAIAQTIFPPKIEAGEPVPRYDAVYPILFKPPSE